MGIFVAVVDVDGGAPDRARTVVSWGGGRFPSKAPEELSLFIKVKSVIDAGFVFD